MSMNYEAYMFLFVILSWRGMEKERNGERLHMAFEKTYLVRASWGHLWHLETQITDL